MERLLEEGQLELGSTEQYCWLDSKKKKKRESYRKVGISARVSVGNR